MSTYCKVLVNIGLLSLLSVLPLAAQVGNGVEFKAPFPFYVGQAEMPAGSYTLTQPDNLNFHVIIVRSSDGRLAAATQAMTSESLDAQTRSFVVFEKYGDSLYLDEVSVEGYSSGVKVVPTKAEKKAEESASITEQRSITARGL